MKPAGLYIFVDPSIDATKHRAEIETPKFKMIFQGVSSIEDILGLIDLEPDGVDSVIAGRAIYEGRLDLKEAFQALNDLDTPEE